MLDELTTEVADAAAGDEDAVAALYRASIRDLTSFVRRRGVDDPEGTASAAFERTVRKLPDFETASVPVFRAYLYRTARNLVIDEGRRRATRPKYVFSDGARLSGEPDPSAPIDATIADNGLVTELLDELTDSQRKVIEYRFLDDLTIEDTATRTGMSVTAVKGMQRRAIVAMRAAAVACVVVALLVVGYRALTRDVEEIPVISESPENSAEVPADNSRDGAPVAPADLNPSDEEADTPDGRPLETEPFEADRVESEDPAGETGAISSLNLGAGDQAEITQDQPPPASDAATPDGECEGCAEAPAMAIGSDAAAVVEMPAIAVADQPAPSSDALPSDPAPDGPALSTPTPEAEFAVPTPIPIPTGAAVPAVPDVEQFIPTPYPIPTIPDIEQLIPTPQPFPTIPDIEQFIPTPYPIPTIPDIEQFIPTPQPFPTIPDIEQFIPTP